MAVEGAVKRAGTLALAGAVGVAGVGASAVAVAGAKTAADVRDSVKLVAEAEIVASDGMTEVVAEIISHIGVEAGAGVNTVTGVGAGV